MAKPIGWSESSAVKAKEELNEGKALWKCDNDAINALENEIKRLEDSLNRKQVKFAQIFATGQFNSRQTAIQAGYSATSAHTRSWELLKLERVKTLIRYYKDSDSLKNGLPLSWKRAKLVEIANDSSAPHASKISAVRLLSELDGNLRPELSGQGALISVNLNLGEPSASQTYEHNGDDIANRGGAARGLPTNEL